MPAAKQLWLFPSPKPLDERIGPAFLRSLLKEPAGSLYRVFAVLLLAPAGAPGAQVGEHPGAVERLARIFSRDVREAGPRLQQLATELEKLPSLRSGHRGARYGFHSGAVFEQEQEHWVQLDLGRSCAIDGFAAMPAHLPTIGRPAKGYGFPLRFKVEVADNAEMQDAVRIVDCTAADVEHSGRYPMVFETEKVVGRHVRFTATKLVASGEEFLWAMDELVILSGNRNVAVGCQATAKSELELLPNWSVGQINDGLSALGMPVTVGPSPTNGYLSAPSDQPSAEKWLVIDLGKEFVIDEIRLLPVQPENDVTSRGFPWVGGRAFPRQLAVELATDPAFTLPSWRSEISSQPLAYPWGNPVVIQCGGQSGRYVRVLTRELWARRKAVHNFALAEMQVYVGDQNVALGKPVQVRDRANRPGSARWAPEFVVDGFTSRHPLVELPEYFRLIGRRGELEREQTMLTARRDRIVRQVGTGLVAGGSGLGAVALLGWVWMLARQKVVRRRDVARFREQIARDLHDDIGSNLGGIVLLSDMGSRQSRSEDEVRGDFAAIKKAAEETAEAMQDIVWFIQSDQLSLRELLVKLRKSVEMIVGQLAVRVVVDPPEYRDRELAFLFHRHFYFAFKEALNNVRKHAQATEVEVRISIESSHLTFEIRDDGVGFDPQAAAGLGHGLGNLKRRAKRLKGTCRLESEPGHGTSLFFKVPFKS